ncbi:PEP-CTERM sorting domain-containing protein [Chitiniphilus purpureus]|uniref:PEP-CTERM sorting domain-containing protein n=1 Tax=Chitiniphilus purpureus TaxID=2981137 RepID=A0ABY6DPH9_9NEIS|nr:PEP-CTERM sorting domain-containing protein [Chitiniphilus sp. CD1]UXY16274.1 PEP-CTERM sorting domain-containing protein [Chitiniphilus sp. CD1]
MLVRRIIAAMAGLLLSQAAMAIPASLDAGQVTIDYDPDQFTFAIEYNDWGWTNYLDPNSITYRPVNNGVELFFGNQIYLSDYAINEQDPLQPTRALFDATFDFQAKPGHRIVGYTVDVLGSYSIEHPGAVAVGLNNVGWVSYTQGHNSLFSQRFNYDGAFAQPLQGSAEALGSLEFIEVQVGTEWVVVGSEWVPDPACAGDPDCPLIEQPIYGEVPVYMQQADLGAADLQLYSITLSAVTAPVPEPEVYALMLTGMGLVGWARRRRKS